MLTNKYLGMLQIKFSAFLNEQVFETPFVDGCNIQNAIRLNTTRWLYMYNHSS